MGQSEPQRCGLWSGESTAGRGVEGCGSCNIASGIVAGKWENASGAQMADARWVDHRTCGAFPSPGGRGQLQSPVMHPCAIDGRNHEPTSLARNASSNNSTFDSPL